MMKIFSIGRSLLLRGVLMAALFLMNLGYALAQDKNPVTDPRKVGDDTFYKAVMAMPSSELMLYVVIVLLLFVTVLALITMVVALMIVQRLLISDGKMQAEETLLSRLWASFDRQMTNAIPLNKENTILLDHNYDGIKELDNHLPPWWLYLFYGTIAFSVVYMLNYHVLNTQPLPAQEYETEMQLASIEVAEYMKKAAANIDETNVKFVKDNKVALEAGKKVFIENCAQCHGQAGEGGIGPNLTDEFWLYGGHIKNVFTVIKKGAKNGMQAWEKKLKPDEMQSVASYILTLQGTNPPNAKEAQGEKYVPTEAEAK